MTPKQKTNTESQAIAQIDEALGMLPDGESRIRVLTWAHSKYGLTVSTVVDANARALHPEMPPSTLDRAEHIAYGIRARTWMRKHGLTPDALDAAFHIEGEASTLILKTVRGGSKRERLRGVAALLGAMALVRTDQAKFTGKEFQEALKQYDAYDAANGSSYVKASKDVIQGTSAAGYTVTAVGLDLAAALLRTSD